MMKLITAFLVMVHKIADNKPIFDKIGIFSASARNLASRNDKNVFYSDLMQAEGKDFEEAQKNLFKMIFTTPIHEWVKIAFQKQYQQELAYLAAEGVDVSEISVERITDKIHDEQLDELQKTLASMLEQTPV